MNHSMHHTTMSHGGHHGGHGGHSMVSANTVFQSWSIGFECWKTSINRSRPPFMR